MEKEVINEEQIMSLPWKPSYLMFTTHPVYPKDEQKIISSEEWN